MKATGIVRRLDQLGRVVLPMELRRTFRIAEKDGLEIFVDGDRIVLRKYEPACSFCYSMGNVRQFKGKIICGDCWDEIKESTN